MNARRSSTGQAPVETGEDVRQIGSLSGCKDVVPVTPSLSSVGLGIVLHAAYSLRDFWCPPLAFFIYELGK